MQVTRRPTLLLLPLLLLTTATAAAPGFGKPITLARGVTLNNYANVALATSEDYVYTAWENYRSAGGDIFFRRLHADGSTAGGIHRMSSEPTWSTEPALAADGDDVAIVWTEMIPAGGGPSAGKVLFRRSADGGKTWRAPVVITRIKRQISGALPRVARRGDTVSIVYGRGGNVWLRTSRDAGRTWAAPVQVNAPGGDAYPSDLYMGAGGLYVAYTVGGLDGYAFLRRSTDYLHWQSPILIGRGFAPVVDGEGQRIVVAWLRRSDWSDDWDILARRSLNSGAGFGSSQVMASRVRPDFALSLATAGGNTVAAWTTRGGVWVAISLDGRTWDTPARIEPGATHPLGASIAGNERLWLGYYRRGERFLDVVVRRGQ